jgi:hypothetical protein
MWVISMYMASPAAGCAHEAILTISFGQNVQYPMTNNAAVTNTEGTNAFVLVDTMSPSDMASSINTTAIKMSIVITLILLY